MLLLLLVHQKSSTFLQPPVQTDNSKVLIMICKEVRLFCLGSLLIYYKCLQVLKKKREITFRTISLLTKEISVGKRKTDLKDFFHKFPPNKGLE